MKRTGILLIFLFCIIGGTAPLFGQMDMLPQIFRDLPPELQQGLPQEMTFQEYRQLNRNVDFLTMFMSMWVPGYGFFQVERPTLGWTVMGFRAAGYGLIAASIYRQWDDLSDLYTIRTLDEIDFNSFKTNALLFTSGILINGIGWAADVVGAFHIAKQEKDYVTYRYGLLQTVRPQGNDEHSLINRIRTQLFQHDLSDTRILNDIQRNIDSYQIQHPGGMNRPEIEHYQGLLYEEMNKPAHALLSYLHQIILFPEPRYSTLSRQHASILVQQNRRAWAKDWDRILSVLESTENYQNLSEDNRILAIFNTFENLEVTTLIELAMEQAYTYAMNYPLRDSAPRSLYFVAQSFEKLQKPEQAIQTYTQLAAAYPDGELTPASLLRIAELLHSQKQPNYALRFYNRLVNLHPQSSEAETARQALLSRENE